MDAELLKKIKVINSHFGKNQAQTAKYIGVDDATVYRWICEGLDPKGLSIRRINDAFNSLPKKKRKKSWSK